MPSLITDGIELLTLVYRLFHERRRFYLVVVKERDAAGRFVKLRLLKGKTRNRNTFRYCTHYYKTTPAGRLVKIPLKLRETASLHLTTDEITTVRRAHGTKLWV